MFTTALLENFNETERSVRFGDILKFTDEEIKKDYSEEYLKKLLEKSESIIEYFDEIKAEIIDELSGYILDDVENYLSDKSEITKEELI